ncbi:MAG: protein kinase domain-containing protein [Solirubrobacterales bacterium]
MVGDLVMGRFRVLERVGSGGMGVVYRAFDERLQRQVAVKEIAGTDARRILREAQAAARLNHPGIVTLYELGSDEGRALLVSELVDGATLAELAHCGDLSDRDVAGFGADVCDALAHAHAHGVIHRDVKPQNVIVQVDAGAGRRAKLMDFGVASLTGAAALTATGEVVGTLAYMAPEQAEGDAVGEPADVYSLALSLYECWAGANPVARETPAQTAREIGGSVPALREYRHDLPGQLASCIDACLDPEPERRPSLIELRRELEGGLPALDDAGAVPDPDTGEQAAQHPGLLRAAQLLALCCWALAVTAISVGGRPGLALILGALSAPAILVASTLPWAAVPALAPVLGAVSAAPVYPAVAALRGRLVERALLGALGWWCMLAAAAAVKVGSRLGLVDAAPSGWSRSTATAASGVLAPLLDPQALLGAAVFGAAAALLGVVLRARHVALALLGALLWAGGLEAALRAFADGGLAGRPALVAAAAVAAVIVEFRRRAPRPEPRWAPIPGIRLPLPRHGGRPDTAISGR